MQHAAAVAASGAATTAAAAAATAPATNNLKLISNERICCHIINELQQKRLPHSQSMGFPWL